MTKNVCFFISNRYRFFVFNLISFFSKFKFLTKLVKYSMETDDNDVWEYEGEGKKKRPLENERHIMQFWYAVNNEIDNGKWRRNTKKKTKITLHRNRNRKMHSNHNKNGNKIIVCTVFVSFSPLRRIQSVYSTYLHYSTYYHSLCVSVSLPFISRNFICFLFLNETICINLLPHTHAHTLFHSLNGYEPTSTTTFTMNIFKWNASHTSTLSTQHIYVVVAEHVTTW